MFPYRWSVFPLQFNMPLLPILRAASKEEKRNHQVENDWNDDEFDLTNMEFFCFIMSCLVSLVLTNAHDVTIQLLFGYGCTLTKKCIYRFLKAVDSFFSAISFSFFRFICSFLLDFRRVIFLFIRCYKESVHTAYCILQECL